MSGNVNEWCWGVYGYTSDSYCGSLRGGSFNESDYSCEVYLRGNNSPHNTSRGIGFRIVCNVD